MKTRISRTLLALLAFAVAGGAASDADNGYSYATINGIELAYRVQGTGENLVLLHSGTQSGEMWDELLPELAARYRVIVPDLRGHGRSTNPDSLWSTRQFAKDITALLDHLEIDRCRAIGASAGAMTLLHMANQKPQLFERLIVIGAGTSLPASCREILATTTTDDLSESAWERLRARHVHGDEQIRTLYAWVASLAGDENDMVFTSSQLARISAPTLVIHGDHDYCFPASMAWEIFNAIPTAFLWVVPNGSHVPITGARSELFLATALEFLDGGFENR